MFERHRTPKAIAALLAAGLGYTLLTGCSGPGEERKNDGMTAKPRCSADGEWTYPWAPGRNIDTGLVAAALGVAPESVEQGGAGAANCPKKLDPALWEDRIDTLQVTVADPIYSDGSRGVDVTCLTVGSNLPKGVPSSSLRVVCPKPDYIPAPSGSASPMPSGFQGPAPMHA